jgi:release factor glutamine methyltransferase
MQTLPRHELDRLARVADGARLAELMARRLQGEPLQYLEGTVDFGPIRLAVDERVLIPRPETEVLWEQATRALSEAGPGSVIVDLCTGSGAMALAFKHLFPSARVIGTDISTSALEVASANATALGLTVEFRQGDLWDALPADVYERIDLVVANPPYVAEGEWDRLPGDVHHEPREALVAGPEGTELIDRIAEDAVWWLAVGGWVFCEIGETQGEHALEQFGQWLDTDLRPDLAGRDRILVARKGARCCV